MFFEIIIIGQVDLGRLLSQYNREIILSVNFHTNPNTVDIVFFRCQPTFVFTDGSAGRAVETSPGDWSRGPDTSLSPHTSFGFVTNGKMYHYVALVAILLSVI